MQPKTQESGQGLKSKLAFPEKRSDRLATTMTDFFGTLGFLGCFMGFLVLWMGWNLGQHNPKKIFDPFPFPALEMMVSVFAIILTISVLISQRRQGREQRVSQQVEFEVNVRAETEITKILQMLHEIQRKLGIEHSDDKLEEMKQELNLNDLHQQLDKDERPGK